jgi:hypothetical protein
MFNPTLIAPTAFAPFAAASITPGPPPVMTQNPSFPSSLPLVQGNYAHLIFLFCYYKVRYHQEVSSEPHLAD